MSTISGFFRSPTASRDIDLLFSTPKSSSTPATSNNRIRDVEMAGPTASQQALSRIIEIITLNSADTENSSDIEEQLGYVTAGTGSEGDDTLTVTGRGISSLDTGNGDDVLTLKSASISDIRSGDGNDVIKASGDFVGAVDGGDGNDDIQLKASLALDILGGSGNDTIKLAADTIRGLDGGDGDDSLTLEGNRIFARGGLGNDDVSIKPTGENAVIEYGFTRGDGQDVVRSNGPLSLALGSLTADEMDIQVSGNTLTASVKGSEDKITVALDGKSAATYRFAVKDGQTMLMID